MGAGTPLLLKPVFVYFSKGNLHFVQHQDGVHPGHTRDTDLEKRKA